MFPPVFPTPESLGFEWASEGDLVAKLAASVGEDAAVAAVVAHRESYFTAEDVAGLREQGFDHVRLPLTWAAFASEADEPEKLVADPAHPDKKQVTVSRAALDRYVATLADAGLTVLIDMHTMPGGSSKGSYNGVFPSPPTFWDDPTLMTIGRGVVREMLRWYLALPETSRAAVGGFTLLNEPAHLLPDKRDVMLDWLAGAAADFRALVVDPARRVGARPPRLVVNLIETCGLNVYNMAEWMARTFAADELQSWAVLDTHMYLAWEHSAPDTWSCETNPEEIKNSIARFVQAKVNEMNDAAARNGIAHTAVSEWSLATNHDSAAGCQDPRVLEALREAQRYAFDQGGVESYFWGWKLPSAGAHQKFWSAQFHGAEMAASDAAEADATAASEAVPGEAVVETDAAASSDDVPAVAEGVAAVEDADDAGVALASEAAEPEPGRRRRKSRKSRKTRAETSEPNRWSRRNRRRRRGRATTRRAGPPRRARGRGGGRRSRGTGGTRRGGRRRRSGERRSRRAGSGRANVAMIDAARGAPRRRRDRGEVDDEISARRRRWRRACGPARTSSGRRPGRRPPSRADVWEAAVPELSSQRWTNSPCTTVPSRLMKTRASSRKRRRRPSRSSSRFRLETS